jgi:hypothetical protein
MYLETKRRLKLAMPEIRAILCSELTSAIGACRQCRRHFDIFNLVACGADGHGKRCLEMHFACGCTPHGPWHLSKLEVGNLVLEAPE